MEIIWYNAVYSLSLKKKKSEIKPFELFDIMQPIACPNKQNAW